MQPTTYRQFLMASVIMMFTAAFSNVQASDETRIKFAANRQDIAALQVQVEDFLNKESNGYPGNVSVSGVAIDRNLKLAACPNPEVSLPAGSRAWGKTSVAVNCVIPKWTIYVQATVGVVADYFVAAMPLTQGHTMMNDDLLKIKGDLTKLPTGIFTDASQVIGRTVNISLMSGTVLRQEMLKQPTVVQQGQTVTLKTIGKGFQVSTEAKALNTAADGQTVQVKVVSGEVIAGVARNGGQVEVTF